MDVRKLIWELEKVPIRGRETKAARARSERARRKLEPTYMVSVPVKTKGVSYDAERQQLLVASEDLGATVYAPPSFDAEDREGRPIAETIGPRGPDDLEIVAQDGTAIEARNQLPGGGVPETRLIRYTVVIREPNGARGGARTISVPAPAGSADDRRRYLRAALVLAPLPPFYARGEVQGISPTIHKPDRLKDSIEIVVADVQCVLITNALGKVLGAGPLN